MVFTHSPEPELENAELGETFEKSKDKLTDNEKDIENMVDKRRDKANKLESRAAIHFVSQPLRLGARESLFAEVSSSMSSTSSVLSPLVPGTNPFSALVLIPDICQFWGTTTPPVKKGTKKCVNF